MDMSIPERYFKSGLERPTRAGARSLPSSTAQARSPRQIPTAMLCWTPIAQTPADYIPPTYLGRARRERFVRRLCRSALPQLRGGRPRE